MSEDHAEYTTGPHPTPWLAPMVEKRPEVALVLHALLLHLQSHGSCTAEDAHHIPVSHPNVRGATMKLLAKCGAVKGDVVERGTTKDSHQHWLFRWRIADIRQVWSVLNSMKKLLTGIEKKPVPQGELAL